METKSLSVGAGAGAVVVSIVALWVQPDPPSPEPTVDPERLAAIEATTAAEAEDRAELRRTLRAVEARLTRIEASRRPTVAPAMPVSQPAEASAAAVPAVAPEQFRAMLSGALRVTREGSLDDEEQQRFWQAARTTTVVDDTIAALEALVGEDPGDSEARMDLADAYVAKLLSVPASPERALWSSKAEAEWQTVIDNDPNHWEAQFTLAYNYSMYPDFMNKTDVAIDGFERALAIQAVGTPSPQHARTYVALARMHQKKGDKTKAREVLEQGRMRHPRDQRIAAALGELGGE